MLGRSIVLFTRDKRGAHPILTALRAAGNEAVVAEDESAALQLIVGRAVDLAILDSADAAEVGRIVDGCNAHLPIIALARDVDEATLLELLCLHGGAHGFTSADAREIATTAEKILRRDVFGIEKYLGAFGVESVSYEIKRAEDRDEVVAAVDDYVTALGAGREVAKAMAMIADELATNAVYNAPRDENGEARYGGMDRRDKVELDPWEYARVDFGCDGRFFAIAVTDAFGALSPSRIRSRLASCMRGGEQIENKAGGAGLGLYTVFTSVNQLVFNLAPGVCSQVIAIADITQRMRGIREQGHSFHLFVDDVIADSEQDGDAIPESVQVSDSMRFEIRDEFATLGRAPAVVPLVSRKDDTVRESLPSDAVRGKLLDLPDEVLGIDTMLGLLRGATSVERAMEIGLRFVANCYVGAVAFDTHDRTLLPWFACGQVADWQATQRIAVGADDDSSVARIAFGDVAETFKPTNCAMDFQLAAVAAGINNAPGLVVPVHVDGAPRYAIYGFGLRYGRPIAKRVIARLQIELDDVVSRFSVSAAA
jgi:hypothetical protein